jgi:hypothetical protein
LKGHWEQVIKKLSKKSKEWVNFLHDMELHPPAMHDRCRTIIDRLTVANNLLIEDVKTGKRKETDFEELWLNREVYYILFKFPFFRRRIYHAITTSKYHHYLEMKRLTEEAKPKQYTILESYFRAIESLSKLSRVFFGLSRICRNSLSNTITKSRDFVTQLPRFDVFSGC